MENQLATFDQILGQESAIEALTSAYRSDHLAHGLIFGGPTGVGKATTARALGALFLCEKPKQLIACGKCDSCRVFAAGNHPDFHLIYRQLRRIEKEEAKAKDLSVEVVREYLIAKAAMKSVLNVGKVFVIEEADLMNTTAQNALLKTLEEPAGRSLIILLTDQPDSLLPTIRSRCQLVRFAALDEKLIREELQKRGIARETAAQAAGFSEGSLGLALRWIQDGVIERAADLTQRLAKICAGAGAADLQPWLKSSAEAYAAKQLERDELASKDQMTREGLALYLKLAGQFFRRRLADHPDDALVLEQSCSAIDAIVRTEGYLDSNVNVALALQQFVAALDQTLHGTMV